MLGLALVFLVGAFVFGIAWMITAVNDISGRDFCAFLTGALLVGFIVFMALATEKPEPTAMDYHQGKCSVQYTIVDSVAIDSVIVFKPENK